MQEALTIFQNDGDICELLAELSEIKVEYDNIISCKKLTLLISLGYLRGLNSEVEIECEVRETPLFREFCGFDPSTSIPSGAVISYSRRLYQHYTISFLPKLEQLLKFAAASLPNLKLREPLEYLSCLDSFARPLLNASVADPRFMYKQILPSGNERIRCSGGCSFIRHQDQRDPKQLPPIPETPLLYRAEYDITCPFVASTLRTVTRQKPNFPLGNVFGVRERCELGNAGCDGGLRTKGMYKRNSPDQPLISYVTVVYNRVNVIQRCMESIWTQSYPNVEYIVVDGGSTDGTLEYILVNQDKIDYFASQPDNGLYDAMNKGISLASGQYVCLMNSDDWCTPDAAETVARRCIETNADVISGRVLFNNGVNIDVVGRNPFLYPNNTMVYPGYFHQGLYASRNAFETVGYFDLDYYPMSDNKWTSLCVTKGMVFDMWEEPLAYYTVGEGTATTDSNKAAHKNYLAFCGETFPFLSKHQLAIYYYTLTHYGKASVVGDRELFPCLRSVKKHLKSNKEFRLATYRAALHGYCILYSWLPPAYDKAFTRGPRKRLMVWFKSRVEKKCTRFKKVYILTDVSQQLKVLLNRSIELGDKHDVSYDELKELAALKSICNQFRRKHLLLEAPWKKKPLVLLKNLAKSIFFRSGILTSTYVRRKQIKSK